MTVSNTNERNTFYFAGEAASKRGAWPYVATRTVVVNDLVTTERHRLYTTKTELRAHLAKLPVRDGAVVSSWTVVAL